MNATTMQRWNDNLDDLNSLALGVRTSGHVAKMSARTVAQCLSGVVGLIASRWGAAVMQETCAQLVRTSSVWEHSFGRLPHENGTVPESITLVATVARGLLPLAGETAVRQALSFWATECDPAVWMALATK